MSNFYGFCFLGLLIVLLEVYFHLQHPLFVSKEVISSVPKNVTRPSPRPTFPPTKRPTPPPVDLEQTIKTFNVNSSSVTITSFVYQPLGGMKSEWVDRVLGAKSIHYVMEPNVSPFTRNSLSHEEIKKRTQQIKSSFQLPEYALWPSCSIEMLGFGLLGVSDPVNHRHSAGVGKAEITVGGETWACFYRAMFENWRRENDVTAPNFWALFYYCPAPQLQRSCEALNKLVKDKGPKGYISVNMTMHLKKVDWTTKFEVKPIDRSQVVKAALAMPTPVSVCVSVPYTTSDAVKAEANGALLSEWIRYYSMLGMKVIIYDRDGANKKYIFKNNKYKVSQGINMTKYSRVVYHEYTIRGLLDPSRSGLRYDNTEPVTGQAQRLSRYESQGHDKALTLTQCRFESKALYGLDNVLVVDFDEFLYCPRAGPSADRQAKFITSYMQEKQMLGIEQILFPQRLVLNITVSPRDCVVDQVKVGKSVFDCFAPYEYYMGGHSVKSLHLGHKCPFTGYHQACASPDAPRAYNCVCNSMNVHSNPTRPYKELKESECSVLHLSTNAGSYRADVYEWESPEAEEAAKKKNNIWKVVNQS